VSTAFEAARHGWEEGHRRLQAAARDLGRYERLSLQVEALTEELRRRLGQVFTLRELAEEYRRADEWARDVLEARVPRLQAGDLAIAQDAAFHAYARGARDYEP
jgi:hypothetical protein